MKNNEQPQHTRGEWKVTAEYNKILKTLHTYVKTNAGDTICRMVAQLDDEQAEANAQRIVKAVNMHDELVKSVELLSDFAKKVMQYPKGSNGYDPVDAANLKMQIEKAQTLLAKAEQK